jgi:hypothetical protein
MLFVTSPLRCLVAPHADLSCYMSRALCSKVVMEMRLKDCTLCSSELADLVKRCIYGSASP